MYDDLVKSLRICSRCDFGQDCNGCTQKSDDAFCCDKLLHQAADAIEELQTYADLYKDMTEKSQRVARKVIDSYPQWIPVTERLPNCNGCYLVWRPHFFGGEIGMPSICYFDGTNTWHDSYGVDFTRILHSEDVTHWMPLPEPPDHIREASKMVEKEKTDDL